MLSQKARYALRALTHLARRHGGGIVTAGEIAVAARVPRKFLELILFELKTAALVESQRGRAGGYRMTRTPGDVTFGEVIRLIDGPLALVPCVSRTAYRRCADCHDEALCAIRHVMLGVRDAAATQLDAFTLADAAAIEPPAPGYAPVDASVVPG